MADVNVRAVITADDRASRTLKNFGATVNRVGRVAKYAAVAGLTAFGAAVAFSIKEAVEAEKVTAQLDAVLKSTGETAGVTRQAALDLASSMQRLTTFSDEEILSAENLLLTFTKINKNIFPDTVKIVADMSVALGQDLKSSSIQVGKALQDPILGVTALRRVGVNFSKDQQEVIKRLVETGQSAKAQQLILKELNTEFGGSAAAAANTFGGKLQQLRNNFSEIAETVGGLILERLTPFIVKLNDWVQNNQPQIRAAIDNIVNRLADMARTIGAVVGFIIRFKDEFLALAVFLISARILGSIHRVADAFGGGGGIAGQMGKARGLMAARGWWQVGLQAGVVAATVWATKNVIDAWNSVRGAIEQARAVAAAKATEVRAEADAINRIANRYGTGSKQYQNAARSFYGGVPGARGFGNATGGSVMGGRWGAVNEAGIEYFQPPTGGGRILNAGEASRNMSTTINLSVNIGTFAGTPTERRKVAKDMLEALKDVASQQGTNLTALIAS